MNKSDKSNLIHLRTSKPLPYLWPVNGLAIVVKMMENMGIDKGVLLEGSGIHPCDLDNPNFFISPEQELRVWNKIPMMTEILNIGLIIGRQYHAGVVGKLGMAALNSNTFLDAIRLVFKYISLIPSYFHFDLKVKANLAFLTMKEAINPKDIPVIVCESEFVSACRMGNDVLGEPFLLNEIRFAYPKPVYASDYQDVFQCPVVFNAPGHMMIFDKEFLFRKLPLSNPMARKIYEKECEELYLLIKEQETVSGQVRHRILSKDKGLPTLSMVAKSMNMSPSTVKRRLREEGSSFRDIVTESLKQKAIDMIQKPSYTMDQVAITLGYSDLSNFYRAFKSWTGHNPGYYRKKR